MLLVQVKTGARFGTGERGDHHNNDDMEVIVKQMDLVKSGNDLHSALNVPGLAGEALKIRIDREEDAAVISLSGELDLSVAKELDGCIRDVEETEVSRIVMDLSDLSFIDSTGLEVLMNAKRRSDSGRLSFTPSRHDGVARVLSITRTQELLDL